ncbi:MAG: hypothetical protein DIU76_11400 [Bacillota bacterium]|nr:MAG: hypothetical protein DIU76_11400 [Bacillota bacterium]
MPLAFDFFPDPPRVRDPRRGPGFAVGRLGTGSASAAAGGAQGGLRLERRAGRRRQPAGANPAHPSGGQASTGPARTRAARRIPCALRR